MITVSSVLSTVLLDTINVLLIDYMYSSFFERRNKRWLFCIGVIVGYVIIHLIYFYGYSSMLLDLLVIFILSLNYKMEIKNRIYFMVILFLVLMFLEVVVYYLLWGIFNYNLLIVTETYNAGLTIFQTVISRYLLYLILYCILYKKNLIDDIKAKVFKYISLGVSVFYGVTIVVFFKELLFYHHTVGRIFVFTLILYNVVLVVFNHYESMHLRTVHEFDAMKRNRSLQEKYWKDYVDSYQWIRKAKHDMKDSYVILYKYLQEGKYMELRKSLESKIENFDGMDQLVYLGNPMVDAVLSKKRAEALELGIHIRYKIGIVSIGDIDCEDLGILMANALNNAIEATVKSSYDVIDVEMFVNSGYLCIKVINYVDDIKSVNFDRTSKLDKSNHGIGIRSMKECVKKYHGYLEYVKEDHRVVLLMNIGLK